MQVVEPTLQNTFFGHLCSGFLVDHFPARSWRDMAGMRKDAGTAVDGQCVSLMSPHFLLHLPFYARARGARALSLSHKTEYKHNLSDFASSKSNSFSDHFLGHEREIPAVRPLKMGRLHHSVSHRIAKRRRGSSRILGSCVLD